MIPAIGPQTACFFVLREIQSRAKAGPKPGQSRAKAEPKPGQSRAKAKPKPGQSRAKAGPKPGHSRAKAGTKPGHGRANVRFLMFFPLAQAGPRPKVRKEFAKVGVCAYRVIALPK